MSAQTANPTGQTASSAAQTTGSPMPTADEIAQNYLSAIGGKEAIRAIPDSLSLLLRQRPMADIAPEIHPLKLNLSHGLVRPIQRLPQRKG